MELLDTMVEDGKLITDYKIEENHAFAFRSFSYDPRRILQRKFFKDFNFASNKSDDEILAVLGASNSDSFDDTQDKLDIMDALLVRAEEYQKHIKRHGDRLTKFLRALEYKFTNKLIAEPSADVTNLAKQHERAEKLSMIYCGTISGNGTTAFFLGGIAINDVGGLCQKISKRYKELDQKIKIHYRKIFAARLRKIRKEQKLTQAELGKLVGFSQRMISNYEKAEREPSIAMLVKISKKLNRPIDWFLGIN